MTFSVYLLVFYFLQSEVMINLVQSVGFPIAVCFVCFLAFRAIWQFFTEQMRCKDKIIEDTLRANTDATKAQNQMLLRISEHLESSAKVTSAQTDLLEKINNLFHNTNKM